MTIQFAYAPRPGKIGVVHQPMWTQFDDADGAAPAGHHVTDTSPEGLWLDADGVTLREVNDADLLTQVREEKLDDLMALRDQIEYAGFRFSGRWYASDAKGIASISARSMAISSKEFKTKKFYWCDMNDANIRFSHKGFHKLVHALDTHRQAVRDNHLALAGVIDASPDPASVDITGGWPNTPVEL